MCRSRVQCNIPGPDGPRSVKLPCLRCVDCRTFRLNQWMNRALAEAGESDATFAVTYTFRPGAHDARTGEVYEAACRRDGSRLQSLRDLYPAFQKHMKRLRKHFDVRYIVVGEYGSLKGRSHFHALLFFNGAVPKIEALEKTVEWSYWDHGHVYFQKPNADGLRYVLKYIQKDMRDEGLFMMSKKPVIGAAYMAKLAQAHVDAATGPVDWQWSHPDMKLRRNGQERFSSVMTGKLREIFMSEYAVRWAIRHGSKRWPNTVALQQWQDWKARDERNRDWASRWAADDAAAGTVPFIVKAVTTACLRGSVVRIATHPHGVHVRTVLVLPPQKENEWHADGKEDAVFLRRAAREGLYIRLGTQAAVRDAMRGRWKTPLDLLPKHPALRGIAPSSLAANWFASEQQQRALREAEQRRGSSGPALSKWALSRVRHRIDDQSGRHPPLPPGATIEAILAHYQQIDAMMSGLLARSAPRVVSEVPAPAGLSSLGADELAEYAALGCVWAEEGEHVC